MSIYIYGYTCVSIHSHAHTYILLFLFHWRTLPSTPIDYIWGNCCFGNVFNDCLKNLPTGEPFKSGTQPRARLLASCGVGPAMQPSPLPPGPPGQK